MDRTRSRASLWFGPLHNLLILLFLYLPFAVTAARSADELGRGSVAGAAEFSRGDFPAEFVFGAGTSSYQYEGGVKEDGRKPSIWDTFTHQGGMQDKSTGDVTADGYHKHKEDVELMSETGLEAYRFSISWSRILPDGRGEVNPKGLKYYNDVIDELISHGIQPHVTLYHLDLPQSLEDEYKGWLSPKIVGDFEAYADVCFREFGDRVLHWTTVNQPNIVGIAGYDSGAWPPNRCSKPFGISDCSAGNSITEPYIAVHHLLLAHAAAANLYKAKYQEVQRGFVGANVYSFGFSPFSNSTADVEATHRARDFMMGWILEPLIHGDYPRVMREQAGSKVPTFTEQQSELLKTSFDFIGLNHYSSVFVKDANPLPPGLRDYNTDMAALLTSSRNDTPTEQFFPKDVLVDPYGLEDVLDYLRTNCGNPPAYVHENGVGMRRDVLNDTKRVDGIKAYIGGVLAAIRKGSNAKGYFVWSFVDIFEFLTGYKSPLGLYFVDLIGDEELRRTPKSSAIWYKNFLHNKREPEVIDIQMANSDFQEST